MWTQISQQISETIGQKFEIKKHRSVSGGCINQGYSISDDDLTYFIKLNQATKLEMFAAEALGLKQILATQTIKVPQPICWGTSGDSSYIVLEWLEFGGGNSSAWEAMGRNLAAMHKAKVGDNFGWEVNNTIGSTPQINTFNSNWAEFFAEHRIGYQLKLAQRRGGNFSNRQTIVTVIKEYLKEHNPQPSLVHGDLWSGNAAITTFDEPVILDPATYYGDRETDLAMTELFGGFPASFYRGYDAEWTIDHGYQERKIVYNLYHILNHFNLFGGGYGYQAEGMIKQILSF